MIDKLLALKENADKVNITSIEVYFKITEDPFLVILLWLLTLIAATFIIISIFLFFSSTICEYYNVKNTRLKYKINKIKYDESMNRNYNLLDKTNRFLTKDTITKNSNKLKKFNKSYERNEKKISFLVSNNLHDFGNILTASITFFLFGLVIHIINMTVVDLLVIPDMENNTDIELKSFEIYNKEIKTIPVNKIEIEKLTKTGKNKYIVIFKDKQGQILEIDFNGNIIETDNTEGVFYEYKLYPLKKDYKGTYFEDEKNGQGIILYGVQEEVIKISKENMLDIYRNNEYINDTK